MQFSLIIITVIITIITTFITFYKMRSMKKRIKSSERALCVAAALISVGFLLEAVTQVGQENQFIEMKMSRFPELLRLFQRSALADGCNSLRSVQYVGHLECWVS